MTKAGSRLIKAAREAREIARGTMPATLHVPADIDIKAIRTQLKLTQDQFAREFGFSTSQIRDWEQNRFQPTGSDRTYLTLICRNPDQVRTMLQAIWIEKNGSPGQEQDKLAV